MSKRAATFSQSSGWDSRASGVAAKAEAVKRPKCTTALDDLALGYSYYADKQVSNETITGDVILNTSFAASYDNGNRLTSWTRAGYPAGSGVTAANSQTWNYDDAGNWNSTSIDGTVQNRTHDVA